MDYSVKELFVFLKTGKSFIFERGWMEDSASLRRAMLRVCRKGYCGMDMAAPRARERMRGSGASSVKGRGSGCSGEWVRSTDPLYVSVSMQGTEGVARDEPIWRPCFQPHRLHELAQGAGSRTKPDI